MQNLQGLPEGAFLSDFALPDLNGEIVRVSDLMGRSYLLLFVSPICEPSAEVLRYLGSLRLPANETPQVIVACSGGKDAAQNIADRHQLGMNVVVQEEEELLLFMRVPATPAAYPVDAHRTTIGPLAVGADAVISLLPSMFTPAGPESALRLDTVRATPVTASLSSRRVGLATGQTAPEIDLPAIGGGSVYLSGNPGRWTLLVFWATQCPRCDDAAGVVAAAMVAAPELAVIIISRGELHDHLELGKTLGPDVQIVLQERRSISRQFDTFETPAAYLIDPAGRIAAPLAKGSRAVQQLIQKSIDQVRGSPA